ncbi:oxygen-insensitive NADPH nitroreductase [Sporosarcina sp. Sa2YVA2]|uniref:Oxygen-insensitive NADPH nitroreductase n=1 Tax=Sporosarcina quadrami TaxID=2762234 RepID=A0ABR8U744_9BACL|nr:oxygen-insensitive NADPH nitroreductase [Sporosarcina quadrami]MBD7983860.1 oxygen-insensitive NADPH nitroreductase [Sporosarcina quadrami]
MVINLLKSHASVRDYKDIPLTKEDVAELVQAGQHAASSNFVQAYSVIYVTDDTKRQQLAHLAKNPRQILSAGAVLIFCADFYRLQKAAELHSKQIDYSHAESTLVATVDVSLFAQNVAIAAESKGYGICYIGGVRNAPEEISDLFHLPEGVAPMFAMTIGIPEEENEVKPRLPVEAIIHENGYDLTKYDEILPAYDDTMNAYYQSRGSNQKDSLWSTQMADFLAEPRRTYMKEFLAKRGFTFN